MEPLVTVLMPTYKGAPYLRQTIDSILNQTFQNLELLIINDCSPDNTDEIIASYRDKRIRYIKNEQNLGISGSSNYGFSLARGRYIARQDHDDISLPDRLAKQVEYMESHPEVGLLGTGFEVFGSKHKIVRYPENDAEIKALLFFKMPLAHQTSMMRKETFLHNNLRYDESFASSNDRKLWIDAAPFMRFHNLPDILLRYRMYKGMTSVTKRDRVLEEGRRLRARIFEQLGLAFSEQELELINNSLIPGRTRIKSLQTIAGIDKILNQLLEANQQKAVFDQQAFAEVCGEYWFKRCFNFSFFAARPARKLYNQSRLSAYSQRVSPAQKAQLALLNTLFCWRR